MACLSVMAGGVVPMPDAEPQERAVADGDPVRAALARFGSPAELTADLPPEQAAQALAQMFATVAAALNRLSRDESARRKGQPDWPKWAQLHNTARDAMLRASMARKLAGALSPPAEHE
jgi:hypothetical protein